MKPGLHPGYGRWVCAGCSFQALYAGQSFADEVITWLRERGLCLAGVYHMAYDERGRAVQADFCSGSEGR